MDNRFEQIPPDEGWKSDQNLRFSEANDLKPTLCRRVNSVLAAIVENDTELQPAMYHEVFSHLSACSSCTQEYEAMQQVVHLIESLQPVALPRDYSADIMAQIAARFHSLPLASNQVAELSERETTNLNRVNHLLDSLDHSSLKSDFSHAGVNLNSRVHQSSTRNEQNSIGIVLVAFVLLCVSTPWGRALLGVDMGEATAWLRQLRDSVSSVPLIGGIISFIYSSLSQMTEELHNAFTKMGTSGMVTLALEIGVCSFVYYNAVQKRKNSYSQSGTLS